MSDNLRRYHAIRNALTQAYPAQPTGNLARHLNTLAALISGIVGSKSSEDPRKAGHCMTSSTYREGLITLTRPWQIIDCRQHRLKEIRKLPPEKP